MLSILDIKKAIVTKLKVFDINIVANDIRSGFEKPAFFVQLMPIGEDVNNDISINTLTVNIHYFSKDKTDLDNLKMIDKLKKVFVNKLEVNDRTLVVSDKRYDIDDNILQFMFDIRYTEEIYKDDAAIYTYQTGDKVTLKIY